MRHLPPFFITACGIAAAGFACDAIEFALVSLVIVAGLYEWLRECEVAERQ